MARKKKTPPVTHLANSVYIDPVNCDSTISCKVITDDYGRLSGNVALSDCTRKIDWYFSNDADSIQKIDNAIEAFKEFRKAFVAARKAHHKPAATTEDES